MEFNEKLQELRKSRGLTQEELAEILYVSRTAVSKWESGRGYPSIDSLKEISNCFSVSIDDLLSGDKLISIAEKENKTSIRGLCDTLFGIADLMSFMLIILPLYPKPTDGYVFSVNLLSYTGVTELNRRVYWALFIGLIFLGILKLAFVKLKVDRGNKAVTAFSLGVSVLTVMFLAMAREAYAVAVAFLVFVIKGMLVLKWAKMGN